MTTARLAFFLLVSACAAITTRSVAVPLPPDLTVSIHDQHIEFRNGLPFLYFSTYSENRGAGPLEVRAGPLVNGQQQVYQRVFDSNGGFADHLTGTFQNNNGAIRFNESAAYYLREVNEDDSLGAVITAREKVAYCLVDSHRLNPPVPGSPSGATYTSCGSVLGISLGWVDNYYYTIPNQNFPLDGVSSGSYYIQNILDPLNRLIETNDANNEGHIKVTIATSYAPEVGVLGNGVGISNNDTTPAAADHTDFGYVDVPDATTTRTFTIQNSGTGTLSLTGVPKVKIIGSSDFTVAVMPPSPVNPGGSVSFQVVYDASALNSAAEVLIVTNDADEAVYRFAIRGNTDDDGDRMADEWESLHNLSDPAGDEDHDGASNRDEFTAGTGPRDAQSVFRITDTIRTGDAIDVRWTTVAGRSYKLYSRPDLPAADASVPGWELVGEWPGTGAPISAAVPTAGSSSRFFRVTTGF